MDVNTLPQTGSKGLYFIANDKALDWVITFLNSLRYHAPDLPICLIPFDAHTESICKLQKTYKFEIFANEEILKMCDEVSFGFHQEVRGYYRKLACWHGPYEKFIYIDTDVVLTAPFTWMWDLLESTDVIFADGPTPSNVRYVWKESIRATGLLSSRQIDFSANAGFFASRQGLFSVEAIIAAAERAWCLAQHMDLYSSDQPFLNYLVVTSGVRFSSLREQLWKYKREKVRIGWWGGSSGGIPFKGRLIIVRPTRDVRHRSCPILFVHWAGEATKEPCNNSWISDLFGKKRYGTNGQSLPCFRYRKLWEFYYCGAGSRT